MPREFQLLVRLCRRVSSCYHGGLSFIGLQETSQGEFWGDEPVLLRIWLLSGQLKGCSPSSLNNARYLNASALMQTWVQTAEQTLKNLVQWANNNCDLST